MAQTVTGKAKFKKDSKYIYNDGKDTEYEILGVYMTWPHDGSRDFILNLSGTDFEGRYKSNTTVISEKCLEFTELNTVTIFPLDEEESMRLLEFCDTNSELLTSETKSTPLREIMQAFLASEKKTTVIDSPKSAVPLDPERIIPERDTFDPNA